MEAILSFFSRFAPLVYLLLAIGLVVGIRRFVQARAEMHVAIYGLEREVAHQHTNQAVSILVLVGLLVFTEFFLVVFLAPNLSARSSLATPTINPLAAATGTYSPEQLALLGTPTINSTPVVQATGCIPGQIMITAPNTGSEIQGQASLEGTANIPNFGFYKYEFSPAGADIWSTVQAGNKIVQDGWLGDWDTTNIVPGDYLLRLVVTDNQGNALPACVIPVRIKAP